MKKTDRYNTSALTEAQFEPGSKCRVLKNKPGKGRMGQNRTDKTNRTDKADD